MTAGDAAIEDRIRATLTAVAAATPVSDDVAPSDDAGPFLAPAPGTTPRHPRRVLVTAMAALTVIVGVGISVARDDGTTAITDVGDGPTSVPTASEPPPPTSAPPTTGPTPPPPTVGPVPAAAWGPDGAVDLAAVPDLIPVVTPAGDVLGAVRAAELFAPSNGGSDPQAVAPLEVVGDDLTTPVGTVDPDLGFVPIGTDPSTVVPAAPPTVYGVPVDQIPPAGPEPSRGGPTGTVLLPDGRITADDSLSDGVDGRTLTEVQQCWTIDGPARPGDALGGEILDHGCETVPIEEAQQGFFGDRGVPRLVRGFLVHSVADTTPGTSVLVVGTAQPAPSPPG